MSSMKSGLLILLCCLALFVIVRSSVDGEEVVSNAKKSETGGGGSSYLDRIKAAGRRAQGYFFPPSLNYFAGDKIIDSGEEGGGERVKEAVVRSLEQGKETVENTAKSAARMATKTAHQATDKVKRSISDTKTAEVKISDYEDDNEL